VGAFVVANPNKPPKQTMKTAKAKPRIGNEAFWPLVIFTPRQKKLFWCRSWNRDRDCGWISGSFRNLERFFPRDAFLTTFPANETVAIHAKSPPFSISRTNEKMSATMYALHSLPK
jgi:hypothetical protein